MNSTTLVIIILLAALVGATPVLAEGWEALLARGDSAIAVGKYVESLGPLTEALAGVEAATAPDDPAVAAVLYSLGKGYFFTGRYAEAEPLWKRALEIRERRYGPNSPDVAKCLNSLAALSKSTGRYAEAEKLFVRCIDVTEQTLGPQSLHLAKSINNLANLMLLQARYGEAERLYQQALGIVEQSQGEDSPEVAWALNNLAALYHLEGRYDDEEPLYRRALELTRNAFGPDHPDVAQQLNNLGYLYHDLGQYAQAEPLYLQSLEIGERVLGPTHDKVAAWKRNLARLYMNEGRYGEAEPLVRKAIEVGEERLGVNNPQVAEFRKTLGDILLLVGRLDEASAVYDQALASSEAAGAKDHPKTAEILYSMNMLATVRGTLETARAYEQRAYLIRRKNFSDDFGSMGERAALDYSRFLQEEASHYLTVLLDQPAGDEANREEIARVVFSTKGLVTDAIFVRHKSLSAIAALMDSLNEARLALSKLYVEGPDPARPWAHQTAIAKATQRKEKFEAELARGSTEFKGEKLITQIDAGRIAAHLPFGTALVEYMRYDHTTGLNTSVPRYLAVVVKSNGRSAAYALGDAAVIDSAVARYRRHLADVKSLNLDEYLALSYDLYSLIWQPFETQVAGMGALFVSPDAALSLVSFSGLRTGDADYLIEHAPLHYVSSGRDMVREPTVPATSAGLLAIGDPDYDATAATRSGAAPGSPLSSLTEGIIGSLTRGSTSSCRTLRDMLVGRLPATRSEISEVVSQWKQTSSEAATTLLDAQATEDAFKKQCHGMRVLHLATHGYYISNECRPDQSSSGFAGESPLLQSGLFFAGANLKGQGAADAKVEDGTLTAEEVAGLNLNGTDLVVLSACETGLGEVRAGEGVFGLRRAFQMAGANTVISALWPVDDKSTAELMGALFAAHEQNLYDAMRQAELKTIQSRRAAGKSDHPYFWAGFVATGDWQTGK